MDEASDETAARARKNHSVILKAMQSVGQVRVAEGIGVSEATISRWKAEESDTLARILAVLGLRVVGTNMRCFNREQVAALLLFAKERMAQIESPDHLNWDE